MPPGTTSRYLFCEGLQDDQERLYLSDRAPFRYRVLKDNRFHMVAEGDSVFTLAHLYFNPLPRPSQYFWVICDFQPDPILDATLALTPGTQIVIPSVRCLVEEIFNEVRRESFTG